MASTHDRSETVFVGFAEGLEPDIEEFRTASGQHVDIYDLHCVDIDYRPMTRRLTITFDGPEVDALPAITVVLIFDGTEIYQWEPNGEPVEQSLVDQDPRLRGQVNGLDQIKKSADARGSFHLSLLDFWLSFHASVVTCHVQEGVMWQPPAASP